MVKRLGYVPALDGLRGIAILLVLACHLGGWWAGSRGVDLFFVLSGFLITTLLLEERGLHGRVGLRGFYVRRARRLLPGLAFFLAAYLLIEAARGYDALGYVARYGLYLGNFFAVYGPSRTGGDGLTRDGLAHLWSLAQEEQYYVLWPILLILLARGRRPLFWFGALALSAILVRIGFARSPMNLEDLYYLPAGHAQGLLLGSLLGMWRFYRRLAVGPRAALGWVAVASLMVLLTDQGATPSFFIWQLTLFEVAAGMVVLAALEERSWMPWLLSFRPLVWVGKISYSLYLWHFLWVRLFDGKMPFAVLALSFASATLSYYLVEQRFRRGSRGGEIPVAQAAPA